jgi:phage gp36-like protein
MYCPPARLADAKLTQELAEATTPENQPTIEFDLMDATLRGSDRSAWPAGEVAIADVALARIETALADADATINGYLAMRKPRPYPLPLDPVPGIVSVWARQIARYLLLQDRFGTREETDPVIRDYRSALRFLEFVREGKFSLGVDDPLPPAGAGSPAFIAPERVFTDATLRDFGT